MPRRDDEFNYVPIKNEEESLSFEFGYTPKDETASYKDNRNAFRDELNDNATSNDEHRPEEQKKKQEKDDEEQIRKMSEGSSESSSSETSSSSASSSGAAAAGGASTSATATTVTAVAGASIIAVASISTLVGINVFVTAKFKFDYLRASSTAVSYSLTLSDTNNDEIILSLENQLLSYKESQNVVEGTNEGSFANLVPETTYTLTIVDANYSNYLIHEETITTTDGSEERPAPTSSVNASFTPSPTSISYVVELTSNSNDEFALYLENTNLNYLVSKEIVVGPNQGSFTDLEPETEYRAYVKDITLNEVIYDETVNTTHEEQQEGVTINFDANGGSGTMNPVYITDVDFEEYEVPECSFEAPTGMTFNFWSYEPETNAAVGLYAGTKIQRLQQEMTFVAHWRALEPDIPISLRLNPGDAGGDEIIEERGRGEEYAMPENQFHAPEGLEFEYWVDDLEDDEELRKHYPYEIITLNYEEEASFTAFWNDTSEHTDPDYVTLTFAANNGTDETMEPVQIPYNSEYNFPECPFTAPDDHLMFAGWLINDSTTPLRTSWTFRQDSVLTAAWTACNVMTYYPDNDIDDIVIDKVKEGDYLYYTFAECPFTAPDGKQFSCWLVDDREIVPGDYVTFESDKEIHTKWVDLPTYHVSFEANGGLGSMEPYEEDVIQGEYYTLPDCYFEAADNSLKFDFWDVNGNSYQPGEQVIIVANTMVIANWTEKTAHTVYYEPGVGATGDTLEYTVYEEDNPYILLEEFPTEFTPVGRYEFVGWQIGEDTFEPGEEISIVEDVHIIAIYEEDTSSPINGLKFYAIYDDDATGETIISLQLDYDDPDGLLSSFVLNFSGDLNTRVTLETNNDVQHRPLNKSVMELLSAGLVTYTLEFVEDGVDATWGSDSTLNVQDLLVTDPTIEFVKSNSDSPIYWNEDSTSYMLVNLHHHTYQSYGVTDTLYLRLKQTDSSDYEYIDLRDAPGTQRITLPFTLGDSDYENGVYIGIYDVELVTMVDPANPVVIQTVYSGVIMLAQTIASSIRGAAMSNTLPSDESSASEFTLELYGYQLTSFSPTVTVTFEFIVSGGDNVTYTVSCTPSATDMANGYTTLNLAAISSSATGSSFANFIALARTHACNVSLTYSTQSNVVTIYQQFNFSVI